MKVTLEFDGNEEQEDLHLALDGYKWKQSMWELDQELRKTTKYKNSFIAVGGFASETEILVAEAAREWIRDILNEYNLNLD